MGITEQEAIKELQTRDEIFVAYSQATKLPYVICDQESFNDQVWVFATEEEIKAFGKKKLEDKILLMGMKYEKKDYPRFYGTLYAIGVNSVVWVDGENQIEVELTRIARQADFSQLEPKKQPLLIPLFSFPVSILCRNSVARLRKRSALRTFVKWKKS